MLTEEENGCFHADDCFNCPLPECRYKPKLQKRRGRKYGSGRYGELNIEQLRELAANTPHHWEKQQIWTRMTVVKKREEQINEGKNKI